MNRLKDWVGNQTDQVEQYPLYLAPIAFVILIALFILSLFIRAYNWLERIYTNEIDISL